ncbi:MAG: glycerol-3-phosphate dehydrogenase/oxidase [Bacteroidales bacterium]
MERKGMIKEITGTSAPWDVVVIGGGASGLGAAVDAAARGYRTLLLEQHDFAKGTSSRSTKLVHGGVRYLAQGNISLVLEALRERGRLKKNAPHLVRDQPFVIPCYAWWCVPFYTIGLTLYDLMAGKLGIGRSVPLSRKATRESLGTIRTEGLFGGVRYYDCQFDDARLAVNLVQTLAEQGGVAANYMKVVQLLKSEKSITGVVAENQETGETLKIPARVVINATGVFVDQVIRMDDPGARQRVKPSQGIHLVMDRSFLKGPEALMIPKTPDGRVLFAVPWHEHVVVGTTDVEKQEAQLEPVAAPEEVEYILETAGRYMQHPPERGEVLSVYTGLRPLAAPAAEGKKTKEISRGHKVMVSDSGLVTLTGGKWTTYRKMGEDVVDRAAAVAGLPARKCKTRDMKIHGYHHNGHPEGPLQWYGSDLEQLNELIKEDPSLSEALSSRVHFKKVQVIWGVRGEMARTVEDILARRTRILQLDAREAIRMAPAVASLMARELGHDRTWENEQVEAFRQVARLHVLSEAPSEAPHPDPNP